MAAAEESITAILSNDIRGILRLLPSISFFIFDMLHIEFTISNELTIVYRNKLYHKNKKKSRMFDRFGA